MTKNRNIWLLLAVMWSNLLVCVATVLLNPAGWVGLLCLALLVWAWRS